MKRGDKALNGTRFLNGQIKAIFGQKVYILWEGDRKCTIYSKKSLVWFPNSNAWSVPPAPVAPANNG